MHVSPALPTAKTRPYFPELDGVRAVAALMVMAYHFSQSWWLKPFMMVGSTGVDLFFVLSGFLITTILLQAAHGDWHEIKNFYIRRTLRIFPLYYFFLVLFFLIVGKLSVWYFFYLQNVVESLGHPLVGPEHFWSLASEEQFYLVWPFLVLFWPRRWLAGTMWALLGLALGLPFLTMHTGYANFFTTMLRPVGLVVGGLLAYYYRKGLPGWMPKAFMGIFVAALLWLALLYKVSAGSGLGWVQGLKPTSAALLYVTVIGLMVTSGDTFVHRLMRSKVMREVGRVSYGLYVYHPLVLYYLPRHIPHVPLPVLALLCLVVSYGMAVASFYLFEKRFTNLKDRFAKEKRFREVPA